MPSRRNKYKHHINRIILTRRKVITDLFRASASVVLLMLVWLAGYQHLSAQPGSANWVLETDSAAWRPRDSQGELVFDGKIWLFGGWFSSDEAPPRDVWNSSDGKNWQLVEPAAPWIHSDLPMTIAFRDRMWVMGGWYNGRLPGHSAGNQ